MYHQYHQYHLRDCVTGEKFTVIATSARDAASKARKVSKNNSKYEVMEPMAKGLPGWINLGTY